MSRTSYLSDCISHFFFKKLTFPRLTWKMSFGSNPFLSSKGSLFYEIYSNNKYNYSMNRIWWNFKWKISINSLEFRSVEVPSYSVHTVHYNKYNYNIHTVIIFIIWINFYIITNVLLQCILNRCTGSK